ncbi:MAG TPA: Fe-S-containing hydro-lyase [Halanaerobiales bacterium]|nr:Fe-S-containing hydro-lyase [Halanaerobiales bacterium]
MKLKTPLTQKDIESLKSGDKVKLSGIIYTARDAAHAKLIELINQKKELPIPLEGQVIYYVGPAPAKPGEVIGAAGPTTSYRMDPYTPQLFKKGLKAVIGKGQRSKKVKKSMIKNKSIYLGAVGGAGALLAKCIKSSEIVAYPELGAEAIRKLEVVDMPLIVINDIYGNDIYEQE